VSSLLRRQLASESRGDGHNLPHSDLSQREFQVFCRLADGQALTEIAEDFALSVKTIASYRARLSKRWV